MSFIATKTVKWTNSPSSDVVAHRVYVSPATQALSYATSYVEVPVPGNELVLPATFDMSVQGDYRVGVSAVDSVGNISDIVEVTHPFDFVPPAPASAVEIITS